MTQESVYKVLKKKEKWMTAKEISKILNLNTGSVTVSLNKLARGGYVMQKYSKENPTGSKSYIWRIR